MRLFNHYFASKPKKIIDYEKNATSTFIGDWIHFCK